MRKNSHRRDLNCTAWPETHFSIFPVAFLACSVCSVGKPTLAHPPTPLPKCSL